MPMNRGLYPPDWEETSRRVREEAGQKCEWCGVDNHARGARSLNGIWYAEWDIEAMSGREIRLLFGSQPQIIRIVLTVAHIDHDRENGARENLAALCQRCHIRHDIKQHQASAAATRARKRQEALTAAGQQGLF